MGAGVSSFNLARAVSKLGQLGVVSGTGLGPMLVRRLQDGDPEGHVRRALGNLPFPAMAERIVAKYFVPGGRSADAPYAGQAVDVIEGNTSTHELSIAGNFVEVFLAREGHDNPVGINYLEKIQLPHLASIYGAMLAGVGVVIMGAGIPLEIPAVLDALARHEQASYPIVVQGALDGEEHRTHFDPLSFVGDATPPPISRPAFFPIISSATLATMLCRRATGSIEGLIVEGNLAGGHNAPPRGQTQFDAAGQPIYGKRDEVRLDQIRKIGLPFWLAGNYGSPERIEEALAQGATGVQVGTAFALCVESGLATDFRCNLVRRALDGTAVIFTDPQASPTGFPFKVAALEGSLSETEVYEDRNRLCDIGLLRQLYRREDGTLGYRCPAEPKSAFVAKGGDPDETAGRKCLCNALVANIGMPQRHADGRIEPPLVTLGDDVISIPRFCHGDNVDFTAEDVINTLLGKA